VSFKLIVILLVVCGDAGYWIRFGRYFSSACCFLSSYNATCSVRGVRIAIIVIIEIIVVTQLWCTDTENGKSAVIFALNTYCVEFEQNSFMRSSSWVRFPRVWLSFFDLSIYLSSPAFRCLVSQQGSWSCLKT